MITETIITVLFGVAEFIVGLLPSINLTVSDSGGGLSTLLGYGLYFFPADVWLVFVGNAVLVIGVSLTYVVIEWVYKKIPGVD